MKLRNNKIITVLQTSTGEVSTFKCITHENYIKNKAYYDKYRDPRNIEEIMNGVYLIIDSINPLHWDKVICDELLVDKKYKLFEIVKTFKIKSGDIITYAKSDKPNRPAFKLTFRSYEDCKNCVKKEGIYYVPIIKRKGILQSMSLYDVLNNCYIGKTIRHMDNYYHILDVQQQTFFQRTINSYKDGFKSLKKIFNIKIKK